MSVTKHTGGVPPNEDGQSDSEDLNIENDTYSFHIEDDQAGVRIDKALSILCADLSRARLQSLIENGDVFLNGVSCISTSKKLSVGDRVDITVPAPLAASPQAENIPLNIVYEDADLLVIDKQAGLVVHPGAGNHTGTLVNALLHHCGDSLSGIGGVMRPGIVHRLDKDTAGLMVAAKSDRAHRGLAAQLEDRSLRRTYKALVFGVPVPLKGFIDQPIARHGGNRLKMTVNRKAGRPAKTHYRIDRTFHDVFALVECRLESGRTHQIRVHMEFLKHPLVGDPLYGPQSTALRAALKKGGYDEKASDSVMNFPRQALHASNLAFVHPVSGQAMVFESPLPGDFSNILKILEK
jgi:23S rRNA pseudouridine1911/1915/1917 synthase